MLSFVINSIDPRKFAAVQASNARATGAVFLMMSIPARDDAAVRAFYEDSDLPRLHRESRLRIDRARNSPGYRRLASLVQRGMDLGTATEGQIRPGAELPTRNGACPCGSGRRFKDCHGASSSTRDVR